MFPSTVQVDHLKALMRPVVNKTKQPPNWITGWVWRTRCIIVAVTTSGASFQSQGLLIICEFLPDPINAFPRPSSSPVPKILSYGQKSNLPSPERAPLTNSLSCPNLCKLSRYTISSPRSFFPSLWCFRISFSWCFLRGSTQGWRYLRSVSFPTPSPSAWRCEIRTCGWYFGPVVWRLT